MSDHSVQFRKVLISRQFPSNSINRQTADESIICLAVVLFDRISGVDLS